jgi:DNA-binding transcriptional regulator YiaG
VTELRSCRKQLGFSQADLALTLGVPVNSLRMWDSGVRPTPERILEQARSAAASAVRDHEPLTLPELAGAMNIHVRTLQAAARTGRLEVQYSTRSLFGRPLRLATRAAVGAFMETCYKRYSGQPKGFFAVPRPTPSDYQDRLRGLRRRLKISQSDLAELVGAANKSVVYQWESRKRVPSPVFWDRIDGLDSRANQGRRVIETTSAS